MTKKKWHNFFAKTHKWIGLILGIQLVIWTVGGIAMSWIPIDMVRGQHKVVEVDPVALPDAGEYLSFDVLAKKAAMPVIEMRHAMLFNQPVVKLHLVDDSWELRDARSGDLMSPISADLAQKIAEADFSLDAAVASVHEVDQVSVDYRGPLPVWQVRFADTENTSLYVSPVQARVVARRSTVWRFYDFFWMLHIMDYDNRTDFNNWLIITTSFFAALFAISGMALLFYRFYRRDFNFILGKKKRS
jgi:PepSY-associated TM region